MVPMENANPMKCTLWTNGKAHSGPFIAFAHGLVVSHSKNDGSYTLAPSTLPLDTIRLRGTRHSITHFEAHAASAWTRDAHGDCGIID
jgi:hypothetical protein